MRVHPSVRTRSSSATALYTLLLLTSLLEAVGQERPCCNEPHLPEVGDGSALTDTQVDSGEIQHGLDCPCCGFCSTRISLDPPSTADPTLRIVEALPVRSGVLFVESSPTSHPSRGPPMR